jgi:hypothetical protein
MIVVRFARAASFDVHENDTRGFIVTLQLWRVCLEWWVTVRRGEG